MKRTLALLLVWLEVYDSLDEDHGLWGFASDLYFEDVADAC